jgi:hypothetical protein
MNGYLLVLAGILGAITELRAQGEDAVLKRGEVSIHTIKRGSMPIIASANGTLTSLQPRRAVLTFDNDQVKCEAGRGARLVVGENPRSLAGKVVRRTDDGNCEVEFTDALPQGAVTGSKVGGLIVTDEMKDVFSWAGQRAHDRIARLQSLYSKAPRTPVALRFNMARCPVP